MDRRPIPIKRMSVFLWIAVIANIVLTAEAMENTTNLVEHHHTSPSPQSWSPWSPWSPCSRRCGGGVSVQTRTCGSRISVDATPGDLSTPAHALACAGSARRYRECNIEACPGSADDSRREQCASYNHRPFRGRYYTWVPYVDGSSPCTLNCRPLGHQFYATLARAADGTPCTAPGRRAVCLHGACEVLMAPWYLGP